jgi:hypothetical protein
MLKWTLLFVVGEAISLRLIIFFPFGSNPWQVGVFGAAFAAVDSVVVFLILLWAQREVEVQTSAVTFRRWTDVLRGRDELSIPVDQLRVGVEGGVMVFASPGRRVYKLWVAYWRGPELQGLKDGLARVGITVEV